MITTLIFDLSEVLIAGLFGIEKPLAAKLGVAEADIVPVFGGPRLDDLCCGRISEDAYLGRILVRTRWSVTPPELKHIIRDNFHHRVPGMEELVKRLAQKYELILLSDHAREWIAYIRDVHPLLEIFRARFYSFELGQLKREPSTFGRGLTAIGRGPEECLFVDDHPANVRSAAAAGLGAIRFTSAGALTRELTQRGVEAS